MSFTLMNPGPVNVLPAVRAALAVDDSCHREPEYGRLQAEVRAALVHLFAGPGYEAILITGSGTAAVEAMVASLAPARGRGLVIDNGTYGARIAEIYRAHRIRHDVLVGDPTRPVDPARLADALGARRYETVALVHHETTTGLLNPLRELAAVCRAYGAELLIDAVSSLAGEPLPLDDLRPAAIACTANKCIQGIPGVSFVLVRNGHERAAARRRPGGLYLDLFGHLEAQNRGSTLFTPAIQVVNALAAALRDLAAETVPRRHARYAAAASVVRDGLEGLGFRCPIEPAARSSTVTTFKLPMGASYSRLHDALKAEGFIIYAGQGPFAADGFRVATMGAVPLSEYERFVGCLAAAAPAGFL